MAYAIKLAIRKIMARIKPHQGSPDQSIDTHTTISPSMKGNAKTANKPRIMN